MTISEETVESGQSVLRGPRFSREEFATLGILFLLALGLRLWVAARAVTIFNDGPRFLTTASRMAAGEWQQAFWDSYHPLYPFLIQAVSRVTGDPEGVGTALSVLAGSLCVLVLYAFFRQIWNAQVAAVGAFLLAIHPYAIRFSSSVQSEALYMLFFVGSVALLIWVLDRPRFGSALLCGLTVGLAYLVRPEGAVVGLVGGAAAVILWLRRFWSVSSLLRVGLGLSSGFFLMALPYMASLKVVTGSWQLSQKKSVLVLMGLMQNQGGPGGELVWTLGGNQLWLATLAVFGAVGFVWFFRRLGRGGRLSRPVPPVWFGLAFVALLAGVVLLDFSAVWDILLTLISTLRPEHALLIVLGFMAGALHSGRNSSLLLGLLMTVCFVMLYTLVLNYGYASRRHFLPALALLFGYGAVGVIWVANGLERRGLRSPKVALAVVLALAFLISVPKALRGHRNEEYAGRLVAERLAATPEPPGLLASDRSKSAYYANRVWYPLRSERGYRSIRQLHASGVRFVLLEVTPEKDPSVLGKTPPGIRLVERDRLVERGRVAFVLEIVESGSGP